MHTTKFTVPRFFQVLSGLCALFFLLSPESADAGGTPATGTTSDELIMIGAAFAPSSTGDYLSTLTTVPQPGLDLPYKFFIEVPSGATDLRVEIFDADLLAGAGDQTGERDRNRSTAASRVKYELFNPSGNRVAARFNYGDPSDPAGSDNGWLTFYNSDTSGITGGTTYRDNFGTAAYNNNDGSANFANNWDEDDDSLDGADSPTVGEIQIVGGELRLNNSNGPTPNTQQPAIHREVDLSTFVAAELSFDWRTDTGVDRFPVASAGDAFAIEASADGGATYDVLEEFGFPSGAQSGSRSYDITGFIASNTRIRIRITNFYAGANENLFIDNLQVRGVTTANGPSPTNGHWEVRVDMSGNANGDLASTASATDLDDVGALGLRAHDGTSGAGGTEYNVYAENFFIVGINDNDRNRTYNLYPYVTAGCDLDAQDFDWDTNQANPPAPNPNTSPFGEWTLTSRSTSFAATSTTMSDNNVWRSQNVGATACTGTTWTDCDTSADYGIWQLDIDIEDFNEGNYGPFYLVAHDGLTPGGGEPNSNPETNGIRIYLPSDADAAPIKPHLAQYLTFIPLGSGNNPPTATGVTNHYAISVVMTNPASSLGSITFSNTNLITSRFTGSDANATVTYQGVHQVSHGSVTSQPTIGSTTAGNITWNPGTLTAGTTASLVYLVDVNWSTLANVTVTGTPGANGTTAVYVDETGDAVNARATFEFGELCELAVRSGALTPAVISSVAAKVIGRDLVVEWQTAAEAGTVSFDLYRENQAGTVKINGKPILALIDQPQGGTYRFVDGTAPLDRESIYWLVEHEAIGRSKTHGPFNVLPESGHELTLIDLAESARAHAPSLRARTRAQAIVQVAADPKAGGGSFVAIAGARIMIAESGLYRVSAAELAGGLGLSEAQVIDLINSGRLALHEGGHPVVWLPTRKGRGIEFYGRALDSPYTGENVYQVTVESGALMKVVQARTTSDWGSGIFRHVAVAEQNLRPVTLLPLDPEGDNWFWDFLQPGGGHAQKSFPVDTPAVAAKGSNPRLKVFLQGAATGSHALDVRVNGEMVGQISAFDRAAAAPEVSFAQSLLGSGVNTVQLTSVGGGLVFVERFELAYDRRPEPVDHRLEVKSSTSRWATAGPFAESSLRVFDIADPRQPRQILVAPIREGNSWRVVWEGGAAGRPYHVVSASGVRAPLQVEADLMSSLRVPGNAADYLVIAPTSLLAGGQDLANRRTQDGLLTQVVELKDIYDEFAFGRPDPRAIRDFLAATRSWSVSPRYVVLLGAGTYDYRNFLGLGGNLIPPMLVSRGDSLYPTDQAFADFAGNDGVPDLAIGRIPVLSDAELQAYLSKVASYENGSGDWQSRTLMLADRPDALADFGAVSNAFSALLGERFTPTPVHLGSAPSLAEARQQLFGALNAGTAWVHYVGHGGVDRLASSGLLTNADLAALTNQVTPILSSVTCHIGLHALPGFDSLGEELVLADAGAVAVVAPAWLSEHGQALTVGDRLFREAFQGHQQVLGDALVEAMVKARDLLLPADVYLSFQLLGDPALRMRQKPSEVAGSGCTADCGGG